jgi:hypothetical protein
MDENTYVQLKEYLRPLLSSSGWDVLSQTGKLRQFRAACRSLRPDLNETWLRMDKTTLAWQEALECCTRSIRSESARGS